MWKLLVLTGRRSERVDQFVPTPAEAISTPVD
jgi:hypothetical protein